MHILMRDLGESEILAGALNGKKVLGKLMERISSEPDDPERVFLDFQGIEVATASFLRECILEFRNTVRRRRSNFYPVVANANETVTEELSILLAPQRDVLLLCTVDDHEIASSPRFAGDLEPKQRITFDLIQKLGKTDAGELMRKSTDDTIGQTAWNNRLTSLARLGIVIELSHGRAKSYRPLLEEVKNGS